MRMDIVSPAILPVAGTARPCPLTAPLRTAPRRGSLRMQPLLNIAVRAARRAGEVIVRGMNRVHRLDIRQKGQNDFVSEIDTQAEMEIIDTVRKSYPDHGFLAEESGAHGGSAESEFVWIIDPLDGTTNFL